MTIRYLFPHALSDSLFVNEVYVYVFVCMFAYSPRKDKSVFARLGTLITRDQKENTGR